MAKGFKTGGRKPGTKNKTVPEVRILAQKYGRSALVELARIALHGDTDQSRVTACMEILDRAYGKSIQAVEAPSLLPSLVISLAPSNGHAGNIPPQLTITRG